MTFTLQEQIDCLRRIGYTITKASITTEVIKGMYPTTYKDKITTEYWSCALHGECMDDLTGQPKVEGRIVDWIFQQELQKRLKQLFVSNQ